MTHHDFMQDYLDAGTWESARENITACGLFPIINRFTEKIRGVEIGIKEGMNSISFLEMCPNIEKLIGIDPFMPYQDLGYFWSEEEQESIYRHLMKNIRIRGCEDRFEHIRLTSMEAVDMIPDDSLHFVFIDGEHTEAAVKAELAAYMPKLVIDGIMSGHDFDKIGTYVRSWVDENLPNTSIEQLQHTSWYFIKT